LIRAVTPNSEWWSRAKTPPRPQPIEIRKRELLATLRKGEHAVTLETPHWRRMRVFKWHEPSLSTALATTIRVLEARGWQNTPPSA
jgi:hypothetical protein